MVDMVGWYREIASHTAWLDDLKLGPHEAFGVPLRPVTHFTYWEQRRLPSSGWGDTRMTSEHLIRGSRLQELFHVPHFPFGSRVHSAWCVRTGWAEQKVISAAKGKALPVLEKIAVMEEIHLF